MGNPKPLDLAGPEIGRSVISEVPLLVETSLRCQGVRLVSPRTKSVLETAAMVSEAWSNAILAWTRHCGQTVRGICHRRFEEPPN